MTFPLSPPFKCVLKFRLTKNKRANEQVDSARRQLELKLHNITEARTIASNNNKLSTVETKLSLFRVMHF